MSPQTFKLFFSDSAENPNDRRLSVIDPMGPKRTHAAGYHLADVFADGVVILHAVPGTMLRVDQLAQIQAIAANFELFAANLEATNLPFC